MLIASKRIHFALFFILNHFYDSIHFQKSIHSLAIDGKTDVQKFYGLTEKKKKNLLQMNWENVR